MRKKSASEEPGGLKAKKKPGRPPMTEKEKEASAKLRAAEKEKAANLKPELFMQYQDIEVNMADLVEAAKADFHTAKKRALITDLKLYIKPEERTAYYVINETYHGKVPF